MTVWGRGLEECYMFWGLPSTCFSSLVLTRWEVKHSKQVRNKSIVFFLKHCFRSEIHFSFKKKRIKESTSHEIWNIFPVRSHFGADHCVERPVKPILSSSVSAGRSKGWAESCEWLQFSLLTHTEMKPDKGFFICLVQRLHATHGRPAVFSTLFFSLCRGYFCIVEVKRTRCQSILSAVQ